MWPYGHMAICIWNFFGHIPYWARIKLGFLFKHPFCYVTSSVPLETKVWPPLKYNRNIYNLISWFHDIYRQNLTMAILYCLLPLVIKILNKKFLVSWSFGLILSNFFILLGNPTYSENFKEWQLRQFGQIGLFWEFWGSKKFDNIRVVTLFNF